MVKTRKNDMCPVCGGTGQINYFKGVSRFLLSSEECPECAGTGYRLDNCAEDEEKAGGQKPTLKTLAKK
jgi:DnaJ-class molecular chaperone